MQEMWKIIEEYPNYEVSNLGRVKRIATDKILQTINKGGYIKVQLFDFKGNQKKPSIHRLVAKAFIPNSENKPDIHHIDHNKENNRVDNLMWVTPAENNSYNLCVYPVVCNHAPKRIASRDYWEINGALFTNLTTAAKAVKLSRPTVRKLCLDPKIPNFRYIPPKLY